MLLKGIKIGFALTGSFQMFECVIDKIRELIEEGAEVIPIMSYSAYTFNTKYGKAESFRSKIESLTGRKIIHTIQEAENIWHDKLIDIMTIAPCSGNTISKLAKGITDTPVTVATKYSLINENSIVIAVSSNDGLSTNAENIGKLLNSKNIYFVPFRQPNPITKPNYIAFDKNYIIDTILKALNKEQIQPLLL